MSRISGKINLLNLVAVRKMIKGTAGEVDCLVLPIEKNKLFIGDKGIYLDLIGFEIEKPSEGQKDTHLLKQSFSKEERAKMTEDQLKSLPILGNLRVWDGVSESEPVSSPDIQKSDDDLPF
jgi:hypothetical protein